MGAINPASSDSISPSPAFKVPTTWKKKNKLQKGLTVIGYALAILYGFGSGLTTAATFIASGIITGGALSYILASLIFVAGFYLNTWLICQCLPGILIDMIGLGSLGKGLIHDAQGRPLSTGRKIFLGFLFFLRFLSALCLDL